MKVCIESADQGFQVYDEANPQSAQMAATVEEALDIAGQMLGVPDDQANEPNEPAGEDAFAKGFESVRGKA